MQMFGVNPTTVIILVDYNSYVLSLMSIIYFKCFVKSHKIAFDV